MDSARIWWVAPSYPIANEIIWPDLKKALASAWVRKDETEHSITLASGGSVTVKSADNPDSLRGQGLDGLVFDEAAFARKGTWTEVLRPALSDREGWAMFISSPNGCNWFYDLFKRAGETPNWERWQRPTSDNPIIRPSELEAAKGEVGPRAYAQEYEAKFTEEDGASFPVEYFPDSMWVDHFPPDSDVAIKCIACDPSLGRNRATGDYSAIVMLAQVGDTYYVNADLDKRPPSKIITDAIARCREFRPSLIGFETNGFQSLLKDDFDRAVAAVRLEVETLGLNNGPDVAKKKRILRLDAPLCQHRFKFVRGPGTELLVDQLRGFPLPSYHDDGPDALEMAVRMADAELSGTILRRDRPGLQVTT